MFRLKKFLVVLFSLAAMMFIVACAGDDGSDGKAGQDGQAGQPGQDAGAKPPQWADVLDDVRITTYVNDITVAEVGDGAFQVALNGATGIIGISVTYDGSAGDPLYFVNGQEVPYQTVCSLKPAYNYTETICAVQIGDVYDVQVRLDTPNDGEVMYQEFTLTVVAGNALGIYNSKYSPYFMKDRYSVVTTFAGSPHAEGSGCGGCHGGSTRATTPPFPYFNNSTAPNPRTTDISCVTCHNYDLDHDEFWHTARARDKDGAILTNPATAIAFSAEFMLCTRCHTVDLEADGPVSGRFTYTLAGTQSQPNGPSGANAHAARFSTYRANHFGPGGYGVNAASTHACTSCHDPHGGSKFGGTNVVNIGKTYAASGHAQFRNLSWAYAFYANNRSCAPCHNGFDTTKFFRYGDVAFGNPNPADHRQDQERKMMASTAVNNVGGMSAGCGTCHALNEFRAGGVAEGEVVWPTPAHSYSVGMGFVPQRIAPLTGKLLRYVDTPVVTLSASARVLAVQIPVLANGAGVQLTTMLSNIVAPIGTPEIISATANQSLTCIACHAGRTSLDTVRAEYNITSQATFDHSTHYSVASGVMLGTLLPDLKAVRGNGLTNGNIRPRILPAANGFIKHSSAGCVRCHDVSDKSHTFAVYANSAGEPIWIKNDPTNIGDIANLTYRAVDATGRACGSSCHRLNEVADAAHYGLMRASKAAYIDLVAFLGDVIESDLGIRYVSSGGSQTEVKIGGVWYRSSGTLARNVFDFWQGDKGLERYLIWLTYLTLYNDKGGHAHLLDSTTSVANANTPKSVFGEILKSIYLLADDTPTAAKFFTWLDSSSLATTTVDWLCSGTHTAGVYNTASGCATRYDNW